MVEYNLPEEKGRDKFKWYEGRNVEQMPKLVAEGRVPMNTFQLMQRRLDFRNGPEAVKTAWMDNYFDTGDAVVYYPNGDVKIVLDSQTLREMTPESQRNNGALVLGEDVYKTLQGEVFKKGKLGKVNDSMSREDVKAHPVWKVLARDQGLLNDYVDYIFTEGKEIFGYDPAMGVYPGSCGGDKPEMRAWCVGWLDIGSHAIGRGGLGDGNGRLVGIAPEALGVPSKSTSNIRAYSMADVQTARKQLDQIAEFMKPESVDKVKSLLGKL